MVGIQVPWPSILIDIWDAVGGIANINLLDGLSVDCISDSFTFYSKFHSTIAYPVVLLLGIVMFTAVRGTFAEEADKKDHKTAGWKMGLFVVFLVRYPHQTNLSRNDLTCNRVADIPICFGDGTQGLALSRHRRHRLRDLRLSPRLLHT